MEVICGEEFLDVSIVRRWTGRVPDGNVEHVSVFWEVKCVVNSELMPTGVIINADRSYATMGKLKARLQTIRSHIEQHFLIRGNVRPQTRARTTARI